MSATRPVSLFAIPTAYGFAGSKSRTFGYVAATTTFTALAHATIDATTANSRQRRNATLCTRIRYYANPLPNEERARRIPSVLAMHSPIDSRTAIDAASARREAVAAARAIFYRPEPVVATLIAMFLALSDADYPGPSTVTRTAFQKPLFMAATVDVFGLRMLHWPMLNLLDAAERQRRTFADALAIAVSAARTGSGQDAPAL